MKNPTAPMNSVRRRLRAAALSAALAPALAFGATTLSSSQAEAAKFEKASCQVHAVLAKSDGEGGVPENLSFLADELNSPMFGGYKSFVLLGTHKFILSKAKTVTKQLASGHPMSLALLSADESQVRLHVKLGQASGKSLIDTEYAVKPAGFVLFAASHKEGGVIFAVQCHGK